MLWPARRSARVRAAAAGRSRGAVPGLAIARLESECRRTRQATAWPPAVPNGRSVRSSRMVGTIRKLALAEESSPEVRGVGREASGARRRARGVGREALGVGGGAP
jgi:hypothetical protein